MIDKLSRKIAISLKNKNVIDETEIDLYHYGFFILISEFIYIFSCILVGIIMKMFLESVIFFAVFLITRRFTGGFHAKTALNCQIISTLSFFISMVLIKLSLLNELFYLSIIIQAISSIIIIVFSPSDTPRKELSPGEKKQFRTISSVIVIVLMIISVILLLTGLTKAIVPIAYALFMVAVLLVLGRLFNHRLTPEPTEAE